MERQESQNSPSDSSSLLESRLPPDILELIFEVGARQAARHLPAYPKPIEIVVSHVNKRWRRVAVNLAALWSFIRASPFETLDKIITYLERSKGHALRVCLFVYKAYWRTDILALIKPHLHRFCQFHLVSDFIHSPPTVRSQLMQFDDMPALECLMYTPLDSSVFPVVDPLLDFTRGAPKMSSLRLNGPTFDLLQLPFAGISQLCLAEDRFPIPFRSICSILQACPSLVKLSFCGHTQRPHIRHASSADVVPFVLPRLRYLILSHGGNSDVILSAMTAPKLCALRLNNFDDDDMAHFLELSHVSKFPALESLSFYDNAFSRGVYHGIARVFPDIRSFASINSYYTDDVLEVLVPLPTSNSLTHMPWPTLATFFFNQAQFQEAQQTMLCTLISSRISLRAPILNLFLGNANRLLLDTDRLHWLRERLRLDEKREMPVDEGMRSLAEFAGDAYIC
ncbi:hypothetical protein C8J57DRAFT_1391970 [Mycena rebaudengoi]|nr:hypothetical protein C8J57DRAFT_1391970 [Mycena rebaudengoi]